MQSEAYKLTGFTAVVSALGFLIRWLQGMRIIDPDTGLATRGMGISTLLTVLILLMTAALAALAYRLGKYSAPTAPEEALAGKGLLYTALCVFPALMLALAGIMQLVQMPAETAAGPLAAQRICGAGALAAAAGVMLMVTGASKPEKAASRRAGSALIILFGGLWLITTYKTAATDPVIWRYAVEILGICGALMAFYYTAGYQFGESSPRMAIFFCHLGGFLCVMAAVDEHSFAESVMYAAVAILLLAWGFTLTANLRAAGPAHAAE